MEVLTEYQAMVEAAKAPIERLLMAIISPILSLAFLRLGIYIILF